MTDLTFNEKFKKSVTKVLKARSLGMEVTYTASGKPAKKIRGIFENSQNISGIGSSDYESNTPRLTVATDDVKNVSTGADLTRALDQFIIKVTDSDITYKVLSWEHAVIGMTTIELQKV